MAAPTWAVQACASSSWRARNALRHLEQRSRTLLRGHAGPWTVVKCISRGSNRTIDIRLRGFRKGGQHLLGHWRDHAQRATRRGLYPRTTDEQSTRGRNVRSE